MDRTKLFYESFDSQEFRQRKSEHQVQLRKAKRADKTSKQRKMQSITREWIEEDDSSFLPIQELPALIESLSVYNDEQILFTAQTVRKILIKAQEGYSQSVIDSGILSYIILWLQRNDFPQLQYECAWIVTNIASGTKKETQALIEKGIVPILVELAKSPVKSIVEQTVWALANIGADSSLARGLILQEKGMEVLVSIAMNSSESLLVRTLWAISNISRGRPPPSFESIKQGIPALFRGLHFEDESLKTDICWSLSSLSENNEYACNFLFDHGFLPLVVQLAEQPNVKLELPTVKVLGNFIQANHELLNEVVSQGGLRAFKQGLESASFHLKKESAWAVSSLCMSSKEVLEEVLNEDILSSLIRLVINEENSSRKEASIAIAHALKIASTQQMEWMYNENVIVAVQYLLGSHDERTIESILEGVECMLRCGQELEVNVYWESLENAGVIEFIEKLEYHANKNIYEESLSILEHYGTLEVDPENRDLFQTIQSCLSMTN